MTKFFEWIYAFLCIFGVWYVLITNTYSHEIVDEYKTLIFWSPFLLIALFGVYSIFVVIYRTLTFNDCPEAAEELRKQIEEAKEDLRKMGFKFKEEVN